MRAREVMSLPMGAYLDKKTQTKITTAIISNLIDRI
jgi:hypothetical protein